MSNVQIKKTTNYEDFNFLMSNREVDGPHVERLKEAIEKQPRILAAQPILVNEDMEVIDGQHRLMAAASLGYPIYYIQADGLGVEDARTMNITQKHWTLLDYAKSYADSGNEHYQLYLKLREEYEELPHLAFIMASMGAEVRGIYSAFRNGNFRITDEEKVRAYLDRLVELKEAAHRIQLDRNFIYAANRFMANPSYDHKRMIRKLETRYDTLGSYTTVTEYLRNFEKIYNHMYTEANYARLY